MKTRFIVSSDIHGYINPINYATNKEDNLGLLKVLATFKQYKNENTITIDNGDILQGSPLMTYYYQNKTSINPITELLNNNYDYINIGNHDFGYGPTNLLEYINSFNGKCLCGNVFYKGKRIGEEYIIHNFDQNKSIALIGCVTQYTAKFESKENLEDFSFEDCYKYVKKTIKTIKEKENVNGIVVVYHGGMEATLTGKILECGDENEGYRMCRDLDFDILISGHQHTNINGLCCGKLVTQCLNNGKEFVVIDYDFENKTGEASIIKANGNVDKNEIDKFKELEKRVQKWLNTNIATIKNVSLKINDEFDARLHKHPLISFINQVQLDATHADLSSTALFNNATGFNQNITMRDLITTYVFENTLVKVKINGEILKLYLEKCADYFVLNKEIEVNEKYIVPVERHFDYDMIDGVDYTIKVGNKLGNRIIEMKYKGKDVKPNDEFSLTINNYRYGGVGGFEFLNKLEVLDVYDKDMVTLIYNYLINNKNILVKHTNNIKVIK